MLAFSEKLTATPWEMKEVDVTGLRNHNLTDHGGALPAEEREMIATVVSVANRCHY